MTTEHDFDGHGGCVPDCSQCRIEEQAATIARLEGERGQAERDRELVRAACGAVERELWATEKARKQAEAERDALRARVASVRIAVDEARARADVTKEQTIAAVIQAIVPLSSVTAEDIEWASNILKEQP